MKHIKSGFTLIELLVVIAIIAILAAILFPVFAQAREKARQSQCISNFKQIGLGIMQYVQDFDEYYPPSIVSTSGGGSFTTGYDWSWCINPYIKSGGANSAVSSARAMSGYYGGVYACPSALRPQVGQFVVRLDVFPGWYNNNDPLHGWGNNSNGSGPAVSMAKIDSPANAIGMWEAGSNGAKATINGQTVYTNNYAMYCPGDYWAWDDYWNAPNDHFMGAWRDCDEPDGTEGYGFQSCNTMPRYRHNGTADMLYLDGHVKAMHKKNWYNTDFAQPGLDCEPFWNGGPCP